MIHRINLTNGNISCIDTSNCQSYTFLECSFQEDLKYEWEIIFSILIDIKEFNAQMLYKIIQCHKRTHTYKRIQFCRQVNKLDLWCRFNTLYHMFLLNVYSQYLRLYIYFFFTINIYLFKPCENNILKRKSYFNDEFHTNACMSEDMINSPFNWNASIEFTVKNIQFLLNKCLVFRTMTILM